MADAEAAEKSPPSTGSVRWTRTDEILYLDPSTSTAITPTVVSTRATPTTVVDASVVAGSERGFAPGTRSVHSYDPPRQGMGFRGDGNWRKGALKWYSSKLQYAITLRQSALQVGSEVLVRYR
jgi:hypothetical protein